MDKFKNAKFDFDVFAFFKSTKSMNMSLNCFKVSWHSRYKVENIPKVNPILFSLIQGDLCAFLALKVYILRVRSDF